MNEPGICRELLKFIVLYKKLNFTAQVYGDHSHIYLCGCGQRDNQEINFSRASNGGIDNFH